jgi:non-ribosomal peptide synthetase component E (peptide arylation enzyme)
MVVDRLPENAVGKVDRKALTRRVADQVEESV